MKKLLVIALVVAVACLIGTVTHAADNAESSVNISSDNPVTGEIDDNEQFAAIEVTSADRDQGFYAIWPGPMWTFSANYTWRLQAKITKSGGTWSDTACIKVEPYAWTGVLQAGAYSDIPSSGGGAGSGQFQRLRIKFDVSWTTAPFTNVQETLWVKILQAV